MWRVFGGAMQPMLGTACSLLGALKPAPCKVVLPTGSPTSEPTPIPQLDSIVQQLHERREAWSAISCKERAKIVRELAVLAEKMSREGAEAAVAVKGSYGVGLGEEWGVWLNIVWNLRVLAESLEASGQPKPAGIHKRPDGQYVVDVFPLGLDCLFFGGVKGEIWIQPGELPTQGQIYRDKAGGRPTHPGVALVLGAGNQITVTVSDILTELLVHDNVVVCKINPVCDYTGDLIRRLFEPLVQQGFVQVVHGKADVGQYLCQHPLVKCIHLTGNSATFDAIVWGPGNKAKAGEPKLKKPVTGELGCVTPYIIVPGDWTGSDLQYYADEVVASLVHNAGHNCLKAEIILTDADWPQRAQFTDLIKRKLDALPRRVAWYPGSEHKATAFQKALPQAAKLGSTVPAAASNPAYLPWMFASGLTPDTAVLDVENWCGCLQEVGLPGCGGDPGKFMTAATEFVNSRVFGSLSCAVFVPPSTVQQYPEEYDAMVAGLKYGSININVSGILGFSVPNLTWGAYPGNPLNDIGSGNCAVHNALLFDHPQKTVLTVPWRLYPTHLWSPVNRNLEATIAASIPFFRSPSLPATLGIALCGIRG